MAGPQAGQRRSEERGGDGSMRIVHAKAPLRLGLAGGGTDVSPYSDEFGGQVLNATISLFTHCHIAEARSETEFCAADHGESALLDADRETNNLSLMLHQAVYRRMVRDFLNGEAPALRVTTYSDAPPGSGVGSSSALVVAMVKAYAEYLRLPLGEYEVARLAYEIERVDCGLAGGKQDQYAAAFGGFNFMEFGPGERVIVSPLRLRRDRVHDLEAHLLLYYTGRSRQSAAIIEKQIHAARTSERSALEAMHALKQAAHDMKEALLRGQILRVLEILCASWHAKKRMAAGISNSQIEQAAEVAIAAGALGLKVSGAGGGGFMMIAVEPPRRYSVLRGLERLGGGVFAFSFSDHGVESWTTERAPRTDDPLHPARRRPWHAAA
jgi:D-glycero-alpha-D-manno-heptose-7-phosphate kinase